MIRPRLVFLLPLLLLTRGVAGETEQASTEKLPARPQAAPTSREDGAQLNIRSQKAAIDSSVFDDWPSIGNIDISNDGNYVLFTISDQPVGSKMLVVRATKGVWEVETETAGEGALTQDNRKAVFIKPNGHLCLLTLGTSSTEDMPDVSSFQLIKQGTGELLAYRLNGPAKELVVRDLAMGDNKSFTAVVRYLFSNDGKTLLLQTESNNESPTPQTLSWVNLTDGKASTIWHGTGADGFVFDPSNEQLAFTVEDRVNNQAEKSIWYYKAGTQAAVLLANNQTTGIENDLKLEGIQPGFSKDGTRLFIKLKERNYPTPKPDSVKVDIWSYTDPKLQSQQIFELTTAPPACACGSDGGPQSYAAVIPIRERHVIRLQYDNETIELGALDGKRDDIVLLTNWGKGNRDEWYWNRTSQSTNYLVSTIDGGRKRIDIGERAVAALSSDRKYVIYRDSLRRNMFSYEVETGARRNIARDLPIPLIDPDDGEFIRHSRGIHEAAWLEDNAGLLIYDKYDIWLLDPAGKKLPVAVTNGYGRRHNIEFHLAGCYYGDKSIGPKDKLILRAFNKGTKDSGFYSKQMDLKGDPEPLSMGPYTYGLPYLRNSQDPLPKARDAELYLVERSSAKQAPNWFYTSDFKTFAPLSHVYPEAGYNWLTPELMTWKTFDGRVALGVLYKPENFSPKKKYPVILHFYQKLSDELNQYKRPRPISDNLEIPWFVSRGYLVFTPDIDYTIGFPGRSAYNSVVSAAKYLATLPWVDSTKMGIQGHSFGAFETNYIVTHTHLFAAAMSSSGVSDTVSEYGEVALGGGFSKQYFYEVHQNRIGTTLWQRPDLYMENSPIFRADKVTTPLLMMNNKEDGIVSFAQGVEFFTALRRLGKKAWMLQYDGELHGLLWDKKAKRENTIRITQFFDHYLKGAPPPKWMTEGVPARLKGIDSGLELDTSGKEPGPGLLREEAPTKAASVERKHSRGISKPVSAHATPDN